MQRETAERLSGMQRFFCFLYSARLYLNVGQEDYCSAKVRAFLRWATIFLFLKVGLFCFSLDLHLNPNSTDWSWNRYNNTGRSRQGLFTFNTGTKSRLSLVLIQFILSIMLFLGCCFDQCFDILFQETAESRISFN